VFLDGVMSPTADYHRYLVVLVLLSCLLGAECLTSECYVGFYGGCVVECSRDCPCYTIQQAIDACTTNLTTNIDIIIGPGEYTGSGNNNIVIPTNASLTLR
jgi:hypothetical protein